MAAQRNKSVLKNGFFIIQHCSKNTFCQVIISILLRCRICSEVVQFQRQSLHQHLKRRHGSSFHRYKLEYLLTNNTEMRQNNSPSPAHLELREQHQSHSSFVNGGIGDNLLLNGTSSVGLNRKEVAWMTGAVPEDSEEPMETPVFDAQQHPNGRYGGNDPDDLQLTDNVNELCLFICGICHKSVGSLRFHIKSHQLKLDQYRQMFPDTEYQRKTHHRYSV